MLLSNTLFDDGSYRCKTYSLCTIDGYVVCEYEYILNHYPELIDQILYAIDQGDTYTSIENHKEFVEVQWD